MLGSLIRKHQKLVLRKDKEKDFNQLFSEIAPAPKFQTQELIVPYKSLEELPKGLRDELLKYLKPDPSSVSADKLPDLQRQYFVYYMQAKDAKMILHPWQPGNCIKLVFKIKYGM